MRKRAAALLSAIVIATMMLAFVAVAPAAASKGPADDRQLTTPVTWWSFTGLTAADVTTNLSAHSARLTDLTYDTQTQTFTVTMVANSGGYKVSSWWYFDLTETQVNANLTSNAARPISLQAYTTASGTRYAVVMVANSGANLKAFWWLHGTAADIDGQAAAHHARPINVNPFPGGGFSAILVDNTSSNAVSWWWSHGATPTAINSDLATNHARLIDVSHNANGTWNAVMYAVPSTLRWTWFRGVSLATAIARANQLGERIVDVSPYLSNGTPAVAVVTISNLDAASTKLWNVIGPVIDSGAYGFYLRQVGGSVLAGLQTKLAFEPAATLELLYHAKSISAESAGTTTDVTQLTYHYNNLADPMDGRICPDSLATTTTTNLKNADTLMMQSSDNRMARAILDKYSKNVTLSYGKHTLGLTATSLQTNIGCSGAPNATTLLDLGKILGGFQSGVITANPTWQSQFRSRMINESNDATNYQAMICPIVNAEAASLALSPATATSFCSAMTWIWKDGLYRSASTFPYTISASEASLTGVPYMSGGVSAPRYFVFADFVDGTQINSSTELNKVNAARTKLYQEALRPYIRAALQTWP